MDNDYAPEIIYLTSSRSSDGYSHPLYYPQHQPGIMYSPHHADSNGWYPHVYSYGNPSYHSPGSPLPPTPLPVPPLPAAPQIPTSASSFADILQLDEFWRGRLAPLPGYQSRPGLVPVKETKRIQIGVPTEIKHSSFFAKEYLAFNNSNAEVRTHVSS